MVLDVRSGRADAVCGDLCEDRGRSGEARELVKLDCFPTAARCLVLIQNLFWICSNVGMSAY